MSSNTEAPGSSTMKVGLACAKTPLYLKGRRSFFQYRDLLVSEASNGRMRAQVATAIEGMTQPTGWHYHVCEGQLVYTTRGWADLQFNDQRIRLEAGDSIFIPGGVPHNEIATSTDFEYIEVSVPAEMGTVACDPPAGLA